LYKRGRLYTAMYQFTKICHCSNILIPLIMKFCVTIVCLATLVVDTSGLSLKSLQVSYTNSTDGEHLNTSTPNEPGPQDYLKTAMTSTKPPSLEDTVITRPDVPMNPTKSSRNLTKSSRLPKLRQLLAEVRRVLTPCLWDYLKNNLPDPNHPIFRSACAKKFVPYI